MGATPTLLLERRVKLPRFVATQTETWSAPDSATARSGRPSLVRSPTAIPAGLCRVRRGRGQTTVGGAAQHQDGVIATVGDDQVARPSISVSAVTRPQVARRRALGVDADRPIAGDAEEQHAAGAQIGNRNPVGDRCHGARLRADENRGGILDVPSPRPNRKEMLPSSVLLTAASEEAVARSRSAAITPVGPAPVAIGARGRNAPSPCPAATGPSPRRVGHEEVQELVGVGVEVAGGDAERCVASFEDAGLTEGQYDPIYEISFY